MEILQPYENALRLANPGISQMQARTIVYWALSTYYDFEPKPILLILDSFGCGKTDLLKTLFPMVRDGYWIQGTSHAAIRDELDECNVAFFDEQERLPENLLARRFRKANSQVAFNKGMGGTYFHRENLNINGWTIVAKRTAFYDPALMSRCLIITPRFVEHPNSRVTDAGNLEAIFRQIGEIPDLPIEGRTMQVWRPLAALAGIFGDIEWINYASINLTSSLQEQEITRQYEPEEAVENAFQICRNTTNITKLHDHWIKISDIKRTVLVEFEKRLSPEQVAAALSRKGHEVSRIDGYPVVKID